VNAKTVTKASYQVSEMDTIELMNDKRTEWVSRSAVKLDDFLEANKIIIG
jgi:predicted rRNA methylase YqxC with S4 and FtsJ domains